MGFEGVTEIATSKQTTLSKFSGQTLAIDASFWFERYYHAQVKDQFSISDRVVKNECDISQIYSLLQSLPDLLRHDITPLFVFDPMRRSRPSKAEIEIPHLQNTPNTSEPEKHFPFLQRPTELLLRYLDIPFCESPLYAEADACVFAHNNHVDAVVSRDYDTLLYGAPITIRKPYAEPWEKIELETVLKQNKLKYRELIDVAILTGTDEVQGPYKGHIKEAISKVRQATDLDSFESEQNEYLRGPSLDINASSPTFKDLHIHYTDPPVTPYPAWPDVSFPDPDFTAAGNFAYQYLGEKPKLVHLLDPIRNAI
ncbi:PIN domain-containing protein [Natronorubrum thiooxidans]|uniref:XPG N-terminal domain-containing protein n=1 Tax=Natronorubrum thiooxidans TaxID=308853 RepID=A0A1N7HAK5_9EURY|nr:hypothetical protein [Natronorubrum thiooxidans]SIS21915.1 XPG N-terminal domain-containing protein [Natronorubrum thiooxidans]